MELIIFQIVILLFSVVIHEVSHGFVAEYLGDPTARIAGRLTLNPIKHLDPFGSFLLPVLLIISHSPIVLGWAKPVPYNPSRLVKDYKYGPLKVALAGPAANLLIALVFGLLLRFTYHISVPFAGLLGIVVFLNILLAIFNLMPIPPLDGSKILTVLLPPKYSLYVQRVGSIGIFFILLFLLYLGGFSFIFGLTSLLFEMLSGPEALRVFISFISGGV